MSKSFIIGFEGSWPADAPLAWAAAVVLTDGTLLNSISGATSSAMDISIYTEDGSVTSLPRIFELAEGTDLRHLWVVATRGMPDIDTDDDAYEDPFVAFRRVGEECFYVFRAEPEPGKDALADVRRLIQVAWLKDLQRVVRALSTLRAHPEDDMLALRRAVKATAEVLGVE